MIILLFQNLKKKADAYSALKRLSAPSCHLSAATILQVSHVLCFFMSLQQVLLRSVRRWSPSARQGSLFTQAAHGEQQADPAQMQQALQEREEACGKGKPWFLGKEHSLSA